MVISLDDTSVSLRRAYGELTRQPEKICSRPRSFGATYALSHEHIQSVTILPDHGVLAGVPDGSTSKQGMRQDFDSPTQRASVER